jgi:hypothetical protein
MSKKIINVLFSEDCYDCELCGDDWASSTLIEYGDWSYGGIAIAHCFDGVSFCYHDCFNALFKHLNISFDNSDNSVKEDFIKFLESLGYTVLVETQELDEDDYYESNYNDYDDYDDDLDE